MDNDLQLLEKLKIIAQEAILENDTAFGGIQTNLNDLRSFFQAQHDNGTEVELIIDNWYGKSGLTEMDAVNLMCDTLEKEMANQMDWFDDLYNTMLNWCNKETDEYKVYKETKSGLIPLLRKSNLKALKRLIEEFQRNDFNDMFSWMSKE